ncbi:hypothetical protein JTB14_006037 [Gonioctena quinquepunctata]|nr:hypothetical protein JTB14_006037 [Gonioctena quinquepunctata]
MASEIEKIITADESIWGSTLSSFIDKASGSFSLPELDQGTKRKDIWSTLSHILKTSEERTIIKDCFVVIRILSREKQFLSELINDEWIDLIKKHSGLNDDYFEFNQNTTPICIEVLKSLSNIMFNSKNLADNFRVNGVLRSIRRRIEDYRNKSIPDEVKFFDMKLLFLITALSPAARNEVGDMLNLLIDILRDILRKASENHVQNEDLPPIFLNDTQIDLVNEVLKALFNITVRINESDVEALASCTHLVEVLRSYLLISSLDLEKTWMLRNNVINLLTNMPDETYSALLLAMQAEHRVPCNLMFDDYNMTAIFEILMFLKAKFNDEPKLSSQNEVLSPVVTVLVKGAGSHRPIRKYLKNHILPPLKDVHNRPEQGSTIRNHLCRMLTTPITQLRDLVAELLFILCKKNVSRMIKYTGYGNAAGLFAQRGLLAGGHDNGADDFSSSSGSETEEYADHKHGINPVIGCYEEPHPHPMQNMTEEQKEYEAMKLVELMDSLLKCGTIKPCRIGQDGKPEALEHVLQLQEGSKYHQIHNDTQENNSD